MSITYIELTKSAHETALDVIGEGYGMAPVGDEDVATELAEIIASTGRKIAVLHEHALFLVVWA